MTNMKSIWMKYAKPKQTADLYIRSDTPDDIREMMIASHNRKYPASRFIRVIKTVQMNIKKFTTIDRVMD